ncbi:hypothetical protein WME95_23930 [Sorangium sp. So ce327]|uniref:hypothetical protein n=1 Tax=unclassified Sorangium TaxID=2621164 RepID=UPI003F5E2965
MDDPSADGGGGGEAGAPPVPTGGGGGSDPGRDPLEEYEDPGCPDTGPPITDFACDPYDQSSDFCAPGEGCFIYVQYPDEPCGQEIYGAYCAPAGPGRQGDPCSGGSQCGAGFACVVTGSGTQCVELCALSGDDNCDPGFVCEPIDVAGMGGCL